MFRGRSKQITMPEYLQNIRRIAIDDLKEPGCSYTIFDSRGQISLQQKSLNFQVIRTPEYDKENKATGNFKFYYIDLAEKPLGEGHFGAIRRCYPINENGEFYLDKNGKPKHAVVKILHNPAKFEEKEHVLFSTQHRSAPIIKGKTNLPGDKEKIYVLMEALHGQEIDLVLSDSHPADVKKNRELREKIKKLTFSERISLIMEIAINLNNLHHDTVRHEMLVHRDIKGSNILVDIKDVRIKPGESQKRFDVSIVDFGLSIEQEEQGSPIRIGYLVENETGVGTALHMAPETVRNQYGIKSDIYALVPLIGMILGVNNPFLDKEIAFDRNYPNRYEKIEAVAKESYNFEDIFTAGNLKIDPVVKWAEIYIEMFLNRMQSQEYQQRPDSDETLRFFSTLRQVCQKAIDLTKISNPDSAEYQGIYDSLIYEDKAKLLLLANGLWNISLGEKQVKKWSVNGEVIGEETFIKTFEDFDFAGNREFCWAIQVLSDNNILNQQFLKNLASNPLQAKAITNAHFHFTSGNQGLTQIIESCNEIKSQFNLQDMLRDFNSYHSGFFDSKHDKNQRNEWKIAIERVVNTIYAKDRQSLLFTDLQEIYLCLKQVHQELELKHAQKKTNPGKFTKMVEKWMDLLADDVASECLRNMRQQNNNHHSVQRQSQSHEDRAQTVNVRKLS